jgi:hypothetical protein
MSGADSSPSMRGEEFCVWERGGGCIRESRREERVFKFYGNLAQMPSSVAHPTFPKPTPSSPDIEKRGFGLHV